MPKFTATDTEKETVFGILTEGCKFRLDNSPKIWVKFSHNTARGLVHYQHLISVASTRKVVEVSLVEDKEA